MSITARIRQMMTASALLVLVVLCIGFASSIQTQMYAALERCLTVMIPSLYAMMILSQLMIRTGVWRVLARPLRRICLPLFGMPDGCFALFMWSQFAGYPVGAGMLRKLYQDGAISRSNAERLLCVCYGGGPAFLLALIGAHPNRMELVMLICLSQLFSNLIVGQLLFRRHPVRLSSAEFSGTHPLNAQQLVESTTQAGQSLLKLCGVILCFAAFCAVLEALGLFHLLSRLMQRMGISLPLAAIIQSLLEVTNAAMLSMPFAVQIPMFAGLLSFGGVCVILQVRATAGEIFQTRLFVGCRVLAGILSATLCRVGMSIVAFESGAVAVAASYQAQHNSCFPVCMLLIMTGMLIYEIHRR